jgi:hypothetical protein
MAPIKQQEKEPEYDLSDPIASSIKVRKEKTGLVSGKIGVFKSRQEPFTGLELVGNGVKFPENEKTCSQIRSTNTKDRLSKVQQHIESL